MKMLQKQLERLFGISRSHWCKSPILKFLLKNNASVTFEIPLAYPETPPIISITAAELTNAERCIFENELRKLSDESLGKPVILDLVIKLQQLIQDYYENNSLENQKRNDNAVLENEEIYLTVILIDHMRQKKKYCDILISLAAELQILGCLLFYQRWIFLFLQGSKKNVKEYITRYRTAYIDVDSSGKPCREKMSKILFESSSSGKFLDFSVKEMASASEMESYFLELDIINIYNEIIQPTLIKRKSCN